MSPITKNTLLKCRSCGAQECESDRTIGPVATGAENKRGGRNVYHIRCMTCGHDWYSVTPRAKLLSRTADEEATQAKF